MITPAVTAMKRMFWIRIWALYFLFLIRETAYNDPTKASKVKMKSPIMIMKSAFIFSDFELFSYIRGSRLDLLPRLTHISRGIDKRRSEEHTSELQSRGHHVCRLL